LPLALAVKQVRGDGKRVFATFEDPNCGYCKRLAKETARLDESYCQNWCMSVSVWRGVEEAARLG
jgi:thioredoxin-related protein